MRLLLVEDNPDRVELFESWLPGNVRLVWAKNAGAALGILERDAADAYAGLLLDHDLQRSTYTAGGLWQQLHPQDRRDRQCDGPGP